MNFIPDVVDKTDPPNKVKINKYNAKLPCTSPKLIPDVPILHKIFTKTKSKSNS